MTASWLAAVAQTQRPTEDFTPDVILVTTVPVYPGLGPAHSMPDCTLWGLIYTTELCYVILRQVDFFE